MSDVVKDLKSQLFYEKVNGLKKDTTDFKVIDDFCEGYKA